MGSSIGRWLFWIAGCIGLAYMLWNLVFSDHGYLVYREEAVQLQQLQAELTELKTERERLASEVLRLRNDPAALEELIHRELGYVHPDEFMLIMPEQPAGKGK
ncbi:MAG: septum formation initiator family protein [Mariprofundus sp.]